MTDPVQCPSCGEPLRTVEEFYEEWEIARLPDGSLVYLLNGGPPKFKGCLCNACGAYVNADLIVEQS